MAVDQEHVLPDQHAEPHQHGDTQQGGVSQLHSTEFSRSRGAQIILHLQACFRNKFTFIENITNSNIIIAGRMYRLDLSTVPTYVELFGCNRLTRQVVQVGCTGSPLLSLDCPS